MIGPNTFRPNVSKQTMRYIRSKQCVHVDGTLYNHNGTLTYVVRACVGGSVDASLGVWAWQLSRDRFGFWTEAAMTEIGEPGVPVNVRNLAGLGPVQYRQLSRLLTLLAMAARGTIKLARQSVTIWALAPLPGDPFHGLPNFYAKTGRATRDTAMQRAQ